MALQAGSFVIHSYCALTGGKRSATTISLPDGTTKNTWHCYYNTSLQCKNGMYLPIQCRMFSPLGETARPDNTTVWLLARASTAPAPSTASGALTPLLEAVVMYALPGTPPSDDELEASTYYDGLPVDMDYPFVSGIGIVVTNTETVTEAGPNGTPTSARVFTVEVMEHVGGSRRISMIE